MGWFVCKSHIPSLPTKRAGLLFRDCLLPVIICKFIILQRKGTVWPWNLGNLQPGRRKISYRLQLKGRAPVEWDVSWSGVSHHCSQTSGILLSRLKVNPQRKVDVETLEFCIGVKIHTIRKFSRHAGRDVKYGV
jgi:hypothetical protein